MLLLRVYLHLRQQQRIEVVNEVGEQVQEHRVEVLTELLDFLLLQFRRFRQPEQVVQFLVLHLAVHHLAVVIQFVDILRAEREEPSDVLLFDVVGLRQLSVERRQLRVECRQLCVESRELRIAVL